MEMEPRGFPEWISVSTRLAVSWSVASGRKVSSARDVRPVMQQGETVVCSGMV